MSIDLSVLHDDMCRGFTTTTADGKFKSDFVTACNLVLDQLSDSGKLDTAMVHVESTEDTIDELNDEQTYLVSIGLIFHLVNLGYKHVRGDLSYQAAHDQWEIAKAQFLTMKARENQSDVDDDGEPENDVAGLGYSGDW